ncbi:MAG: lamin tail domain-containing protein [Caldilineaceae bacterium]|nr:lamin tail domain-containing protein [Caldilineaceae bacterium]
MAIRSATIPDHDSARFLAIFLVFITLFITKNLPAHARPLSEEEDLPPTHVIADHVVISEVQVAGSVANDEFIELYNPTASEVDMTGWRLTRKTSNGNTTQNFWLSFPSGTKIRAYGYFLVVSPEYTGSVTKDLTYDTGTHLAPDNTIILYSDQGLTVVDIVGYGTITNNTDGYEGSAFPSSPPNGQSIERKAFYFSKQSDMSDPYPHASFGNSYDSGNNEDDFITQTTPNPQNSSSPTERCCTTVQGNFTLQGRPNPSGIQVLMWPGSNLRATTDIHGDFFIPMVPAFAIEGTTAYTVEATFPGYLSAKANLTLSEHLDVNGQLPESIGFQALRLLAGDINRDNRVNIFDLSIIGSQYGDAGSLTGDVNGDGKVNIQDLSLVSGNFGTNGSQYAWVPE